MARTIRFDDLLDADENEARERAKNKDLEIVINVAGEKEKETKTLTIKMNIFGLLTLSFKEGGSLPGCLTGAFTSLEEVKSALDIWQQARHKEFVIDPEIKRQAAEAAKAPEPTSKETTDTVNVEAGQDNTPVEKKTLSLSNK